MSVHIGTSEDGQAMLIRERNDTGLLDEYGNNADAYVWGTSEDGRYALVVRNGTASVWAVDGLRLAGGRWECSEGHLGQYEEVYRKRFPVH